MYLASKGICPLLCRDVYQKRLRWKKCCAKELEVFPMQIAKITYPLAITMWDFSWLERRWPGAGYEDWDLILDELNEFPSHLWAPFFSPQASDKDRIARGTPEGTRWMSEAIAVVRAAYPELDYCFSFISEYEKEQDVSFLDLLELHIFMTMWSDFDQQVGYHYEFDASTGYENMVQKAEALYRSRPEHWKKALSSGIELAVEWSRYAQKPLITTECWGVINYKDWPLLNWEWVKELCEYGVRQASATGRWVAMATSSFCGPQFVGMWRDADWHRRLTDVIHTGPIRAGAEE